MDIINCKDCCYFFPEEWGVVDKLPAVIGYNICSVWKDTVTPTGFCYKAKPKDEIK